MLFKKGLQMFSVHVEGTFFRVAGGGGRGRGHTATQQLDYCDEMKQVTLQQSIFEDECHFDL